MYVPTIGLSFIFRDDIETISPMLESILPWVQQVVAVDTGSTDGTRQVIEQALKPFGKNAQIVETEWVDDFAAARQVGWKLLSTDWGIWIDCDDILDNGEALRQLVNNSPDQVDAWVCNYDYAQTPTGQTICTLPRERILRGPHRWSWASPVHEVLMPNFPANMVVTEMPVWRHRKFKQEDSDRNLRIIERHLREHPDDPDIRMLIYHATELASRGRHEEAITAYKVYLPKATWGEEKHQAFHRLADSFRALGRHEEAIEAEAFAMTHAADHQQPEWADHLFGIGESLMAQGKFFHATQWFERGLPIGMPKSSMILNPRDYDFLPHFNLAICYGHLGMFEKAMEHAMRAREIMPEDPALLANMRQLQVRMSHEEAVRSTIAYLQTLVRFDENLKAREALKTLPYAVRVDDRVRELAAHIRRSTFQIGSPSGYEKMYATNREVRNPDDFVENASEVFGRVQFLVQGLREQGAEMEPVRLLDAGCNDGWVAAHVEAKLGLALADGIDLNPEAIQAARKRADQYGLSGRYETGFVEDAAETFGDERYDAIACFEVFEHLEDPHESFAKLERALKPGGRVYVSTPVGAFEQGMISNWHENWAKQHLRAVTPTEFARFALMRGELRGMSVGQDGVQCLANTPMARKGHLVIYTGPGWEPWGPGDIVGKGLGGSETAAVKMAEELARLGWFVEVYGELEEIGPINGVLYRPWREYDPDDECDIFVCSRQPMMIRERPGARRRVLWLHDCMYGGQLRETFEEWDEVLALSAAHEDALRRHEELPEASFVRTRNGIDLARYEEATKSFAQRLPRVIYSSSPDRGLEHLLRYWPEIKRRVPNAELHVFYGFDVFDRMHAQNHALVAWKDQLVAAAEAMPGVTLHGRVSQEVLAEAQMNARVWAYPTPLVDTETSCITAMEAMAAGMAAVTSRAGALPETLGNVGAKVAGEPGLEDFDKHFTFEVVRYLTKASEWNKQSKMGRDRAANLAWAGVASEWSQRYEQVAKLAVSSV
jgi:2-polyprenyl-3-methyl-5-hydroxy-6-metoxy-1,4-benzoquinol methylase/glycosyltransferase involved in cell wall biosynthesis